MLLMLFSNFVQKVTKTGNVCVKCVCSLCPCRLGGAIAATHTPGSVCGRVCNCEGPSCGRLPQMNWRQPGGGAIHGYLTKSLLKYQTKKRTMDCGSLNGQNITSYHDVNHMSQGKKKNKSLLILWKPILTGGGGAPTAFTIKRHSLTGFYRICLRANTVMTTQTEAATEPQIIKVSLISVLFYI